MRYVICDICDTRYPESEARCPICGTSREYAIEDDMSFEEEILQDVEMEAIGSYGRKKQKEIFDFDEVNMDDDDAESYDDDDDEDEDDFEDEPKSNTALIVVLVILIALLLLAVGFMFFRFILPNITGANQNDTPVVTTTPLEVEIEEPTEYQVPCTDLSIPGGKVELSQEGQYWLLNVQVFPQNTTDILTYYSEDESVITVDEDGLVTAVGEGKTDIVISCGRMELRCTVTVDYHDGTEPAEEETIPGETIGEETEETVPGETQKPEETKATEETKAADIYVPEGEILKLKQADITIGARYVSYQLEMDCQIPVDAVKWVSLDSSKVTVVDGLVTAVGPGITRVVATYGDQTVECIIRCNFT